MFERKLNVDIELANELAMIHFHICNDFDKQTHSRNLSMMLVSITEIIQDWTIQSVMWIVASKPTNPTLANTLGSKTFEFSYKKISSFLELLLLQASLKSLRDLNRCCKEKCTTNKTDF